MSQIIVGPPVKFTITITPKADGTALVETDCSPEKTDLVALVQAMLGICGNYLLQVQQQNTMLVGRKTEGGGN